MPKIKEEGEPAPGATLSCHAPNATHDKVADAITATGKTRSFVVAEAVRYGLPHVIGRYGQNGAGKKGKSKRVAKK